jgi:hypothetical protein
MPVISLDDEPEAVRAFVRRLSSDRSDTVLTLRGRTVAWVIQPPKRVSRLPKTGEWTDKLARRRSALIDKEVGRTITDAERVELDDLTARMRRYVNKVAPIPVAGAERLLEELLAEQVQRRVSADSSE